MFFLLPVVCVRVGSYHPISLFAVYFDDQITHLKNSGYGIYVVQIFTGCALYADDIVLLSASCYGLQNFVNICRVS